MVMVLYQHWTTARDTVYKYQEHAYICTDNRSDRYDQGLKKYDNNYYMYKYLVVSTCVYTHVMLAQKFNLVATFTEPLSPFENSPQHLLRQGYSSHQILTALSRSYRWKSLAACLKEEWYRD